MKQLAREYVVLVLATLVWGSVHPTVKFALSELTGMQLALFRPVCACLVLMTLVLSTGRAPRLLMELRAAPGVLCAMGVLGYATSGTLTSLALTLLPAGVTSLISNASPLVLVIGGLALFRQRIGPVEMIGSIIGFGGVAVLTAGDLQFSGDLGAAVVGSLLALGSATAWAVYTAVARRLGRADPLITTAITSFIGSLVVGFLAVPTQDWSRLAHVSTRVLLSTVWAGAVATGCTYAAWSFALRRLPAVVVAPFAYLIPVSALAISHVWLAEPLTLPVLIGAGLVLAGVALSQATQFSLLLRSGRRPTIKV